MPWHIVILASVFLIAGCAMPVTNSSDSEANYQYVFPHVNAPRPIIVHSHVERFHHSVLGLGVFPLASQYNGDWEFELLASPEWVDQVKERFAEIPFASVPARKVPDWFSPSAESFTVWRMQITSYPNAHLFIEKPQSRAQIRIFIRRH